MKKGILSAVVCMFVAVSLVACGGGGDGGGGGGTDATPSANYSGTWSFPATLALNDCNLSDMQNTLSLTNYVTHSGTSVNVVSGTVNLSGTTNDKDGFEVYSDVSTDSNGCQGMVGIRYDGASDGNADAALAIVVQCESLQCTVGYQGTAVRTSTSTALALKAEAAEADTTLYSFMNQCRQHTFEKSYAPPIDNLPLDKEGLKQKVTEITRSALDKKRS